MDKKMLAPSILSADFGNLREQVRVVVDAGVEIIHVDCMDNHFVPNLTIGPVVLDSISRDFDVHFDVHLMVQDPDSLIEPFVKAGATMISVHVETAKHLQRTLTRIRELGAQAGVVLNPATSIRTLDEVFPWVDFILLMTVNPGFAAQKFIPSMLNKIRKTRQTIQDSGFHIKIEVDGGVKKSNCKEVVAAGADIIVAGSAVFGKADPPAEVREFHSIIRHE